MIAVAPQQSPAPEIIDFDNRDTHWHRCSVQSCGYAYAHMRLHDATKEEYAKAHMCPKCGVIDYLMVTVTYDECLIFLMDTPAHITGFVRTTSFLLF